MAVEQFDGKIEVRNTSGTNVGITLNGDTGNITAGHAGADGDLVLRSGDTNPANRIHLDADKALISAGGRGKDGHLTLRSGGENPRDRIRLDAGKGNIWVGGNDEDGDIVIFPKDAATHRENIAEATIHLDGDAGDIKLMGADCAEYFEVVESHEIDPGSVLVAGQERSLGLCNEAYDKRVVGVVSGAGEFKPGIVLNKKVGKEKGTPVALVGTVFCKVDAQYAALELGDLLTTSPTAGHAMKAVDSDKSFGTVLGKALGSLESGQGLVPIIVTLR